MNRKEIDRRINGMTKELAAGIHSRVLKGVPASKIRSETGASVKEVNAIVAWTKRFGRVVPEPTSGVPEDADVPGLRALFNWF